MLTPIKIAILALLLCAVGCSGSQFSGGLVGREKSDKQEGDGEIIAGDESSQKKKAEEEATDDPQQVAGSFLTMECSEDPARAHDEQNVTVGCVIQGDDGKKADISGATNQQWSLLSPLNFPLETTFADEPAESPYHRTLLAPRALLSLHSVKATFDKDGTARDLVAYISPATQGDSAEEPVEGPNVPVPDVVEVGQTEDFQIGDDGWSESTNQGCAARLQAVDVSGPRISSVIRVTSATAKVAVMLKDICGATTKANYVRIMQGETVIKETTLTPYADSLAIEALDLTQGEYKLVIESKKYSNWTNDIDDFVVGRILLVAEGEAVIDRPTAP
jgi:hypothetical protein